MPYLILAEERELPYELLVQLAEVMDESPDLVLADATRQLRSSHGILTIPEKEEAERLAVRFRTLGVPTFLRDKLLEVPLPKPFPLLHPQLEGAIELAAVAHLEITTEHRQLSFNPLNIRMMYPNITLPGSSVETTTVVEHDSHYAVELFARTQHWRGQVEAFVAMQDFLKQLDLSNAYQGAGIRLVLAGERPLPTFTDEHSYDRYVTWLYQLRYGPGEERES